MPNLVAYIPVLNNRHLQWFEKHSGPDSRLYLVHQELAESLVPQLARNIGALPTWVMAKMLRELDCPQSVREVIVLDSSLVEDLDLDRKYILADEDVTRRLAERYLSIRPDRLTFETIWARWDMSAIKRKSPVMPDVETTFGHWDRLFLAQEESKKSPDWWRQVGAALFVNGQCVASACNDHYPTQYEQDAMGDPRMNYEAGQHGKYLSFHAEKTVIVKCAEQGISTKGSCLYVTTFPCEDCARAIVLAGIDHLFFEEGYSALDALEILRGAGVQIVQIKKDPVSA